MIYRVDKMLQLVSAIQKKTSSLSFVNLSASKGIFSKILRLAQNDMRFREQSGITRSPQAG